MHFWKGQALGNDYLVLDGTGSGPPSPDVIRGFCDRHTGVGADGVLVADLEADPVGLRIFNPDGTEAEKSGNGLRIFGAWLRDTGRVGEASFRVALPGEPVEMTVLDTTDGVHTLRVDMGVPSFRAGDLPFDRADPEDEVQGLSLAVAGTPLGIHLVSMGNPHCVVFFDDLDEDVFRRLAPALQARPAFTETGRRVGPDWKAAPTTRIDISVLSFGTSRPSGVTSTNVKRSGSRPPFSSETRTSTSP